MKKINPFIIPALIVFLIFMAISCDALEVIFKDGVWVGLFLILAITALIVYLYTRKFYKNN